MPQKYKSWEAEQPRTYVYWLQEAASKQEREQ